jgi:hypothetical protein
MLIFAPRPSAASIKTYERSESIVALLLLEFTIKSNLKTAPQTEQSEVKKYEQSEYIGQLSTGFFKFFLFLIFFNIFKYF